MSNNLGFITSFSKAFLIFVSATFSFEICSMSMYTFDVGPGNFTLFKYENRAFIVDCGTYRSDISSYADSKEFRKTVADTLSGIDHVKVAVTHAHIDHYGLIKPLFFSNEAVCSKNKIDGILVCARNPIVALKDLPVTFVTNISDAIYDKESTHTNEKVVQDFLRNALFEFPDESNFVQALMVNSSFKPTGDENNPDYVHDINMIFKITSGDKKKKQAVLLPGDASAGLISVTRVQYPDLYENVECVLWSHHGSCATGQEALIAFAPRNIVSIISSFPKQTWYLPRERIKLFLNTSLPLQKFIFSTDHKIWFCDDNNRTSIVNSSSVFMTSANRIEETEIGIDYIKCDFRDGWLCLSYNDTNNIVYCAICRNIIDKPTLIAETISNIFCDLLVDNILKLRGATSLDTRIQSLRNILLLFNDGEKYSIKFIEKIIGVKYASPYDKDMMIYFKQFSDLELCDLPEDCDAGIRPKGIFLG